MLKEYYRLTKPGIVYGNVFTTLAGFLFASRWHFTLGLFLSTVFGIALVIASACVFNNYLDRDIDAKMARTKTRALVSGKMNTNDALSFGMLLGVVGFGLLYLYVNTLTAGVALIGFLVYVPLYTYAKRVSHWGVVVGSISGAMPIVVGYTAVAARPGLAAVLLFLALALWQMPHFYAISIYRFEEYAAADIPLLPQKKGMQVAKLYILSYIFAFVIAASALTFFGYAGYSYVVVVALVGMVWFVLGVRGFHAKDNVQWARKLFFFSLIVLVVFSVALAFSPLLP